MIGAALTALLALAALVSLVWSPYPPAEIDIPPSCSRPRPRTGWAPTAWAATSRRNCWWAAQNSIAVGVIAVGIGLVAGVILGCLASARRGWVEELVMRWPTSPSPSRRC
jgi:peptide/nickel transport system permease protein